MIAAAGGPKPRTAEKPDERRRNDEDRKGDAKEEDGDEGGARDGDLTSALERSLADPQDRFDDDGKHRCFQAEEQRLHHPDLSVGRVDPAQNPKSNKSGEDEQRPRDDPAVDAMHQPPDIYRELMSLWAGEEHAVVERVQEAPLAEPMFFLDQYAVHDRDLAGGTAEAQRRDTNPRPECFAERNRIRHGIEASPVTRIVPQ